MTCPPPPDESAPTTDEIEVLISLTDLIAGLSKPQAFGVEGPVEVVQTHVSAVFLGANSRSTFDAAGRGDEGRRGSNKMEIGR